MTKRVKWRKGRPLMLCPECGENSEPDFIDLSRDNKPAAVVMKCKCGRAWAFEVDQVKGPDGRFYKAGGINVT